MKLRFFCPVCEYPGSAVVGPPALALGAPAPTWACPRCDHVVSVPAGADPKVPTCAFCGNGELYKKKDFPHTLGMGILGVAFLASTVTYYLYDKVLTWVILLGSAAFDGLLYLLVKDVVVCYRCHAEHRRVPTEHHQPFELATHERYRQEQLRRESLSRE